MLSERKVSHFRMNRGGIHIHDNIYSNKKENVKLVANWWCSWSWSYVIVRIDFNWLQN